MYYCVSATGPKSTEMKIQGKQTLKIDNDKKLTDLTSNVKLVCRLGLRKWIP